MMVVTWQNYGRNKPDSETMRFWFDKLINHDIVTVGNAFDYWLLHNDNELPTIKNILDLCKPKQEFHKALPKPTISDEQLKKNLDKISDMVKPKDKTDYKKWARDILANPKGLPDISIRFAKEALNIN